MADAVALNEDAVIACADLVGRTGASDFEIGYLHDDVPVEEAGWYAHAQYRGARITTENHRSPTTAAIALAERLLAGATCRCRQPVTMSDATAGCRWRLVGPRWQPGCDAPPIPCRRPARRPRRHAARPGPTHEQGNPQSCTTQGRRPVSGPRFALHADGRRWAVRYLDGSDWIAYDERGRQLGPVPLSDDELAEYAEAVLVVLPEPVVTARACGCGIAPEGAPGAAGCSAECMAPELISFGDRATLCFPELAIVDGSGESYTAPVARQHAAALLAAAVTAEHHTTTGASA